MPRWCAKSISKLSTTQTGFKNLHQNSPHQRHTPLRSHFRETKILQQPPSSVHSTLDGRTSPQRTRTNQASTKSTSRASPARLGSILPWLRWQTSSMFLMSARWKGFQPRSALTLASTHARNLFRGTAKCWNLTRMRSLSSKWVTKQPSPSIQSKQHRVSFALTRRGLSASHRAATALFVMSVCQRLMSVLCADIPLQSPRISQPIPIRHLPTPLPLKNFTLCYCGQHNVKKIFYVWTSENFFFCGQSIF